ncbi:MAG: 3-oxoacyl-[acyl-carrier-protein] reductase [Modestobacter sp.]|nr:3-oxoacyl-[acyl-carrier-protein] reductase [Modestobacter sp.]
MDLSGRVAVVTDEQFDAVLITVNAIVPVAATAMTETAPFLEPYVDAPAAGDPLPASARQELGFGSPEDAAGLVAFPATDAAAGTGQAKATRA